MRVHTMMWMLRALWSVVAHDLSEYRYMDDVTRNLFSLFCSTWRAVLKMFMRLFRIKASEAIQERKMEKRGQKELLTYLRMPKLQEIFTTAADRVSWLWETRRFAKCFRHYSALSKERRWRTFPRNCMQLRWRKKEEAETKGSAWDLKNA